jgi:hypothetical protein
MTMASRTVWVRLVQDGPDSIPIRFYTPRKDRDRAFVDGGVYW